MREMWQAFVRIPPGRRYFALRAWGYGVLATVLGLCPFVIEVDTSGRRFCYALATLYLIAALVNFRRARRSMPGPSSKI